MTPLSIPRDVTIDGSARIAFVSTLNGIKAIDIKNPKSPWVIWERNDLGTSDSITTKDGWVYLANRQTGMTTIGFHGARLKITITGDSIIKNDENGNPQMPELKATAQYVGATDMANVTIDKVCWTFTVEYTANTTAEPGNSRKGLTTGDGFRIPASPIKCTDHDGITVDIPWGASFGGGLLKVEAEARINGKAVSGRYPAEKDKEIAIQGQAQQIDSIVLEDHKFEDTKIKENVCKYLENPTGVSDYGTVLAELGREDVFRIISYHESAYTYAHFEKLSEGLWTKLGSVLGYDPKYVFPMVNKGPKGSTYNNPKSDGGFGLMQLTNPKPSYEEIWNYRKNIDAGVKLIKEKRKKAKKYLNRHYWENTDEGKWMLRLETYRGYGPHDPKDPLYYWKWDKDKNAWIIPTILNRYPDKLEEIEKAIDAGNFTSSNPEMRYWKYEGEQ